MQPSPMTAAPTAEEVVLPLDPAFAPPGVLHLRVLRTLSPVIHGAIEVIGIDATVTKAEVRCLYCGLGIREPEIQRRKEVSE